MCAYSATTKRLKNIINESVREEVVKLITEAMFKGCVSRDFQPSVFFNILLHRTRGLRLVNGPWSCVKLRINLSESLFQLFLFFLLSVSRVWFCCSAFLRTFFATVMLRFSFLHSFYPPTLCFLFLYFGGHLTSVQSFSIPACW